MSLIAQDNYIPVKYLWATQLFSCVQHYALLQITMKTRENLCNECVTDSAVERASSATHETHCWFAGLMSDPLHCPDHAQHIVLDEMRTSTTRRHRNYSFHICLRFMWCRARIAGYPSCSPQFHMLGRGIAPNVSTVRHPKPHIAGIWGYHWDSLEVGCSTGQLPFLARLHKKVVNLKRLRV